MLEVTVQERDDDGRLVLEASAAFFTPRRTTAEGADMTGTAVDWSLSARRRKADAERRCPVDWEALDGGPW